MTVREVLKILNKDGDSIPEPSQPLFDDIPAGSVIVPITVFPEVVKNEMDNRSVKTNITLPAWLKELAEKQGVNFSQITQAALRNTLVWIDHKDKYYKMQRIPLAVMVGGIFYVWRFRGCWHILISL